MATNGYAYPGPDHLVSLIDKYGSAAEVARILAIPESTFTDAVRRMYPRNPGLKDRVEKAKSNFLERQAKVEAEENLEDNLYGILRSSKDGISVEELCNRLDVTPRKVRESIKTLSESGKFIRRQRDGDLITTNIPPSVEGEEGTVLLDIKGADRFFIGVVSDTHFGSKVQQPTALRNFMEAAEERYDPVCWLHPGDIIDGKDVYRGHDAELFIHDFDEQVEYAAEVYPHTGKKTYIAGGNHDESWIKVAGADPFKALARYRPDIELVGWRGAYIEVAGTRFYLWHGTGGLSYAKSYKLQKRVEGFSYKDTPDVLLAGHWHQGCYVLHRDVHAFLCPSFQGQTKHITSYGYQSAIGGMVLECAVDNDGELVELTPHMSKMNVPAEKDRPHW